MAESDGIRICTKCRNEKPLFEFSRTKDTKLGRVSRCKACISEYQRINKAAILDRMRSYYQQVDKARRQESRRQNPEKYRILDRNEYLVRSKKNLPISESRRGKQRAARANRRAREFNANGLFTADQEMAMLAAQKFKCVVCRQSIKEKRHRDHVIPLSRGGNNDASNIQLLCPTCNLSKNNRDPIAFMQSRGFLL